MLNSVKLLLLLRYDFCVYKSYDVRRIGSCPIRVHRQLVGRVWWHIWKCK